MVSVVLDKLAAGVGRDESSPATRR
ncbi:MAG: hypothetical protein M3317_10065 [Actinomycetota bacterium]|nr:hypothetical protein [Actinomycetota bacterium]